MFLGFHWIVEGKESLFFQLPLGHKARVMITQPSVSIPMTGRAMSCLLLMGSLKSRAHTLIHVPIGEVGGFGGCYAVGRGLRAFLVTSTSSSWGLQSAIVHDDAWFTMTLAISDTLRTSTKIRIGYGVSVCDNMPYILDRFHSRGHADPWCLEHCHP